MRTLLTLDKLKKFSIFVETNQKRNETMTNTNNNIATSADVYGQINILIDYYQKRADKVEETMERLSADGNNIPNTEKVRFMLYKDIVEALTSIAM